MKVICIDASNIKPCYCGSTHTTLIEGHNYNATQCPVCPNSFDIDGDRECVYCGAIFGYSKKRFIETSNCDETKTETYKSLWKELQKA